MSGCTADATVNGGGNAGPNSIAVPAGCAADTGVTGCVGNSIGYSCSGTTSPDVNDASLVCSMGTPSGGQTLYCCASASFGADGCTPDSSMTTCAAPYLGFSCTGGTRPDHVDSSLVCSDGTPDGSATLYCCASYVASSSTATCAEDTSVTGCGGSAIGFSCSGSDSPDQANSALSCSTGTPSGSATLYCCNAGGANPGTTPTAACSADAAVACTAPATGYTCTGGEVPTQTDSTLSCGAGASGASGATGYCCNPMSTATAGCAQDSTVSCSAPAAGYTCTGGVTPVQTDPNLTCGSGAAGANGATSYCCNAMSTATAACAKDTTVTGCPSGADGYSCTGGTDPMTGTMLLCGAAMTESNGTTGYCCTSG